MLYWHNPFPIYPATYVFRVLPRRKTVALHGPNHYYTCFFWGNDGTLTWDGGSANTYYGAHPYPIPEHTGPGQWEISVYGRDLTTGKEVVWDRWYTQVFRAWRDNAGNVNHEFYWNWPNTTTDVLRYSFNDPWWAARNPPRPAIVVGQTPNVNGLSWGGYQGWEEWNGVIRGMQFYDANLSLADIAQELASPGSTRRPWYLNLNPTPQDTTDKSGSGHHPSWDGTTAALWIG
jgi:hypothetical protein